METRRTALVDLSLDLIQKLIAHGHLAGSIYNISHRRDPASRRSVRKVGCTAVLCFGRPEWPGSCHASMAHRTLCVMPQPDVSHPTDQ